MKKLLVLPFVAGCLSEDTRLVASWIGVYEIERYALDSEACGPEGPEVDPPAPFVGVDAVVFEDVTHLNLRQCDSIESCSGAPWFEITVDDIDQHTVTGTGGTYVFMAISVDVGACTLQSSSLVLTRDGENQLHVEAQSYIVEEALVPDEDACAAVADEVTIEDCVGYHVIDSHRVE